MAEPKTHPPVDATHDAETVKRKKPSPPEPDALAVLKALAEASGVFVALTFVGGWSYLSTYYKTFGLNPLDLNISIPVVSTIAVYLLYDARWFVSLAGILIVALTIAVRRIRGLGRGWVLAAVFSLLVIAAGGGTWWGRRVANLDTMEDTSVLPNVAFAAKVMDPEPSCVEYETYGSMDCKLLLHFNSTYYFFHPVQKTDTGSEMNLYVLLDSDLLGVHVQRVLEQTVGP